MLMLSIKQLIKTLYAVSESEVHHDRDQAACSRSLSAVSGVATRLRCQCQMSMKDLYRAKSRRSNLRRWCVSE